MFAIVETDWYNDSWNTLVTSSGHKMERKNKTMIGLLKRILLIIIYNIFSSVNFFLEIFFKWNENCALLRNTYMKAVVSVATRRSVCFINSLFRMLAMIHTMYVFKRRGNVHYLLITYQYKGYFHCFHIR